MIRVGDKLSMVPTIEGGTNLGPQPCKVVYIHPEGRYFVAEFTFALGDRRGSFRESFWLGQEKGAR